MEMFFVDIKVNVLIIEDDKALSNEIKEFLERWGYNAYIAENFEDILSEFCKLMPQLLLMDVNLPYYDGFYWCGKIRNVSNVPIIYISSRNDDKDKIMAIACGGDDYVEKPFHLELLKAKIDAIIRRTYQYKVKDRLYITQTLYFEYADTSLHYNGAELDLTKSERKIISKLVEQKSQVVTREQLMMELWSTDEFVSEGTLTTLVCRLRNKLKASCGDEIIMTKKGQGYYIA